MKTLERFVHKAFHIDNNRINARGGLPYMSRLENWHKDEVIRLDMSQVANDEAKSGNDFARDQKAHKYIYSLTYANTDEEIMLLKNIEQIIFPTGANTRNKRNDVEIVFNAWKYGRILITDDGGSKRQPGGIIGNSDKLKAIGITVMRDSEAVTLVENAIKKRDEYAREIAAITGSTLPAWAGKD